MRGSRLAGPGLGDRARPVGGGLHDPCSGLLALVSERSQAGGAWGRGGGAACCAREGVGAPGRRVGACRGGGGGAQLQRAPPTARTAELCGSGQPVPRGPARWLQRSLESNRLSRRDVSAPPPRPRFFPPLSAVLPLLPPPPAAPGSRTLPAAFCCHCDVTKGRARVEPPPPP